MFVHFNRTTIPSLWLLIFGLLALLWSPLSVAMGVLLLMVGISGPAAMLILWGRRPVTVALAAPRVEASQRAR
jgi:hypothetical protein